MAGADGSGVRTELQSLSDRRPDRLHPLDDSAASSTLNVSPTPAVTDSPPALPAPSQERLRHETRPFPRRLPCCTVACAIGQRACAQLPTTQLTSIFPPGGKQGTTVEVTIAGADLDDVEQARLQPPRHHGRSQDDRRRPSSSRRPADAQSVHRDDRRRRAAGHLRSPRASAASASPTPGRSSSAR